MNGKNRNFIKDSDKQFKKFRIVYLILECISTKLISIMCMKRGFMWSLIMVGGK